jgi:hypothetical protein
MPNSKIFTFKYEGDLEYIDVNTLLLSQLNFIEAINEIQTISHPDIRLNIKVKPLPKGSYQLELLINFYTISNLFKHITEAASLMPITDVLEILKKIIELKKFLGGEKPFKIEIKGNIIEIFKADNSKHTTTTNIYNITVNSPTVNEGIRKAFEVVEKDEEIKGINILDETNTSVMDVKRESFKALSQVSKMQEEKTETQNVSNAIVSLVRVVFADGVWQFIYDGHKVSANIDDSTFKSRVNTGKESFASGDALEVDLTINKVYDESANAYINKSYIITKVHKHIPRPSQSSIDF